MNILSLIGIQDAVAQTAPATAAHAQGSEGFMSMIWMLVAFMFIFYFLLIRPQSKRAKEQRKLLESLTVGDEILTSAGIVGKIIKIGDGFLVLNVADGVNITLQKNAITSVLPKGTMKTL